MTAAVYLLKPTLPATVVKIKALHLVKHPPYASSTPYRLYTAACLSSAAAAVGVGATTK